jgi:hypothetical protein
VEPDAAAAAAAAAAAGLGGWRVARLGITVVSSEYSEQVCVMWKSSQRSPIHQTCQQLPRPPPQQSSDDTHTHTHKGKGGRRGGRAGDEARNYGGLQRIFRTGLCNVEIVTALVSLLSPRKHTHTHTHTHTHAHMHTHTHAPEQVRAQRVNACEHATAAAANRRNDNQHSSCASSHALHSFSCCCADRHC